MLNNREIDETEGELNVWVSSLCFKGSVHTQGHVADMGAARHGAPKHREQAGKPDDWRAYPGALHKGTGLDKEPGRELAFPRWMAPG